jgi:hypothetical protein
MAKIIKNGRQDNPGRKNSTIENFLAEGWDILYISEKRRRNYWEIRTEAEKYREEIKKNPRYIFSFVYENKNIIALIAIYKNKLKSAKI